MKFRYRTYIFLAIVGASIAFGHQAFAQTRLGLHVTQEELNVWRARMTDNVNTINGFTFQSVYQNRILADANSFRSQTHPGGDGSWVGYTGAGCAPDGSSYPGSGGTPYGRGNGAWMMRSAFNFLLTGDTSYANPIRTELLAQIVRTGTDFSNSSKWCSGSTIKTIEITPWVARLAISYDYLIAGGYTGFSVQEKANILQWFVNATQWLVNGQLNAYQNVLAYPGIYNTPQNLTCVGSPCSTGSTLLYQSGPTIRDATANAFGGAGTIVPGLAMTVGILANRSDFIDLAVKHVIGFVTAGLWQDGSFKDYGRWSDCSPHCPGSMWSHTAGATNDLLAIADMYARTGNTSLYDLTIATQVIGGNGAQVSLRKMLVLLAQLANDTTIYRTGDGLRILTWDAVHSGDPIGDDFYHDFGSMVANLYYRDSEITTAMTRNTKRSNTSTGCYDPQLAGCFSGAWSAPWADLPFMFGKMEGKVNPYGGSRGASVSLTTSPTSITSGQSSTLSWFSSNVTSCAASDGWSGSKTTNGTQTVSPTQTTTYTLTCTGSGGSASASANVTVLSPLTQVPINSGGPTYTGPDGTYEADRYASGGNTYSTTASIANTADSTLYQTERYGNFTYEIPMANGTYNVTLKFAEIFWTGTGQRVFNVDINGTRVLSNFDIVAQAGGANRAIDRTFPATVSNGMLSIAFSTVIDNAKVSGIVVSPSRTEPFPPGNLQVMSAQ